MTQGQTLARQQQETGLSLDLVTEMTGYSLAEVSLIRQNMAASLRIKATDVKLTDIAMFCKSCRGLGLDPLVKQAYWIDRGKGGSLQIAIDGFRAIADRAGNYAGSSEPTFRGQIEWKYKSKTLIVPEYAQVLVWKIVQGHKCSFAGEARWLEYVPRVEGAGDESSMWAKMPHNQLAKCAEAQALRKGWALQLGKVDFSTDEPDMAGLLVEEQPQRTQKQLAAEHARIFDANYADDKTQATYVNHDQEPAESVKTEAEF